MLQEPKRNTQTTKNHKKPKMTTLEKIKAELTAFEEKKKAFVEDLRKEFPSMFKELFDRCERIESFSWNQFTPYFNDGDTCEFRVNCDYPYVNGEYIDEHEWYSWKTGYFLKGDPEYKNLFENEPELDKEACLCVEEFKGILGSIPEEFMKDLFGDHATVTMTRNGGVSVDECRHD